MSVPHDSSPVRTTTVQTGPAIGVGTNLVPVRNRVQWGPIVAGVVAAIHSCRVDIFGHFDGAASEAPVAVAICCSRNPNDASSSAITWSRVRVRFSKANTVL